MINPSTSGWIGKFFSSQNLSENNVPSSPEFFYKNIQKTGFIFGHIVVIHNIDEGFIKKCTSEEVSKIALLSLLFDAYKQFSQTIVLIDFFEKIHAFYNEVNTKASNFHEKVTSKNNQSLALEKIIDERVQTNGNIISKNFSSVHTNALLFIDVLAFQQFLAKDEIPKNYLKKLEDAIISLILLGIQTKSTKSSYDELIIRLFEKSVRYTKFSKINTENLEDLSLKYFKSKLEQFYLLDIAQIVVWQENGVEKQGASFVETIAKTMKIDSKYVQENALIINDFFEKNRKEIPAFKSSNAIKNFYGFTADKIKILVSRNSERIVKELTNNTELMLLIKDSTFRNLDYKEKKKMKKQLLEICKTIPALTIFLLPGGSLLMPFFIKYIPQIIPSVFNENLTED